MKIVQKRNVGLRQVFDLSVDDNHNFIASGIVVHNCGNYRVAKNLIEQINSPRLITHESFNREEKLQEHIDSKEPTVLVSPSMTEGVDLRDDASRWQVIAKVPFLYLGDEMTKKRMDRNGSWYDFVTARTIIQSLGRSIRNENDHAVSYILDSDWRVFFRRAAKMFNADFRGAYHEG